MRLRHTLAPLGASLILLTSACSGGGGGAPGDDGEDAPQGAGSAAEAQRIAEDLLSDMELKDKVGQLLVLTVSGTTPEVDSQAIEDYRPGGFIYFPENLESAGQIAALSNGLQERAADTGAGVPLFLGIDQEQGLVARLPIGARFPDAMAVGATGDPDQARTLARTTADELAALGINLDYAPVADVNSQADNPVIGVRSFGSDPDSVSEMAVAEAEAFQKSGVVPVAKHFPGHGDTDVDSHTGLPTIDKSREDWEKTDLPPFRAAVDAGVDAIMTAHVVMPQLDDSGAPATLSRDIIGGILRDELGYDGVVTTDALNMEGVRQAHDDGENAVRAILAGADQLLMPPDPKAAVSAVTDAVKEGRISEERLDESVLRILKLKARRGVIGAEPVDPDAAAKAVGSEKDQAAAQKLADTSMTLLRNKGDVLPLADGASVYVTGKGAETIGAELRALGYTLASTFARADATVVGTADARRDSAQQAMVQNALGAGKPVVVIAQGTPYDLSAFPEVDAYLATYSAVEASRVAAARTLAGKVDPAGRLPVDLPGTDLKVGAGLGYRG
ncbi:glycosyl hydrolase [Nocardiopsis gilva YIM 90087]|uniref:beta-N-acetylhexosaminidase n=1 Tax=Nocardiopsis gilva YIM 90087 TaxID=1235441 RepID=A0A223SBI0_9ACTN|nr:glycoside hydrolase family 3 protein [Nocardiopsis gilva]ASU85460.1 glycosyl hydrolase [Nocardiopsis gilva YIM 90087]